MAAIRETLTLEDAFSANFTRYIALGQQAAGASDLASTAARNYQSVANSLDRKLISLNAQFAVLAQEQQAMVAAGRQNTTAFSTLDAKVERLGGTIRETQAQYDAVVSQMERAQAEAKKAASATEELAASQQKARASSSALSASLGQQAAGGFNLAANTARSYESTASRLSRQLDSLNTRLAATAQAQLSMVAAGRQNTAAFAALGARAERLSGSLQETQAQYDAAVSQMERAQSAAKQAASATDGLANSQKKAKSQTDLLSGSLRKLVGAYAGIRGVQALLNLSDTYASNTARIDMMIENMNDDLLTTAELQNQIYLAAQRSRGQYQATTNLVAKLGTLAGDAFSSSAETVAFAEQLNKQIALSGASTQAADASMLQLIQAMSSGVLRGEELNSILEQTPTIAQTIASYMGVSVGTMKELASEGKITSEVVKTALLSAADETNAKFAEMPMTWGQVWNSVVNRLTKASEPLLEFINLLANNMDTLEPIIVGVAAAVTAYAIATGIWTAATWLADAANRALITTLLTNPLTWIAVVIGVVIAVIYKWIQSVGGLQVAWMIAKDAILYAFDYLKIGLFTGIYAVMNFLDQMALKFQSVGVAVANFIGDMKVNVLTILQSMVNGAIDIINGLINTVNKLPGVAFETIEHVTFATEASVQNEAAKASRNASLEASRADAAARAAEREQALANMQTQREANHASRLAEIEAKKAEIASQTADNSAGSTNYPTYDEFFNGMGDTNSALKGIGTSVGKIEKSVNMSDEDIKSLVDMAERRYVTNVNLTSQTPVINIHGANTGNTEADRQALADAIDRVLTEQMAYTAFRATAVPT